MHLVGCVVVLVMQAKSGAGNRNLISKRQRVSLILWVLGCENFKD